MTNNKPIIILVTLIIFVVLGCWCLITFHCSSLCVEAPRAGIVKKVDVKPEKKPTKYKAVLKSFSYRPVPRYLDLADYSLSHAHSEVVTLYLTDGTKICTHLSNVIIYEAVNESQVSDLRIEHDRCGL